MPWVSACPLVALADATPIGLEAAGVAVCVVRLGEDVLAVHDECTHEAVPLSEGDVDDHVIECWRHGSRFDLRTGDALNPPAVEPVATYRTRVVGGQVEVDIDVPG